MPDPATLRPADPSELEQALAHALQFDGRKTFRVSGEMMAKITAAHLVEQIQRAGFVVMKGAAAPQHHAPAPFAAAPDEGT
jgi:transketolase